MIQMARKAITSSSAPAAIGPFSQAIEANGFVFCSGQIGINPATGLLPAGIEAQTDRAILNIQAVLEEAGLRLSEVVKTTIFMTNVEDFPRINARYALHFAEPMPARSAPTVAALPLGALVAIDAIAVIPSVQTRLARHTGRAR
jgi:2-iminobutanoate/2-iminopropanoate deaminase